MPPNARDATTRQGCHHTPPHARPQNWKANERNRERQKQEERERKIKIKRGVRERLRVRKVHKEFHFNNNNKQDIEVNCMIVKKIQVVCSVGLGKLGWGS